MDLSMALEASRQAEQVGAYKSYQQPYKASAKQADPDDAFGVTFCSTLSHLLDPATQLPNSMP